MERIKYLLQIYLLSGVALSAYSAAPALSTLNRPHSTNGFIENKGQIKDQYHQANDKVQFLYCSPGFNVQLRISGFSYDTYIDVVPDAEKTMGSSRMPRIPFTRNYHRVDVELPGSNPTPEIVASGRSETYQNYIYSGESEKTKVISEVYYYHQVLYKNVYPGIDLEFRLKAESTIGPKVEYDFIVHPGADASRIKLRYSGANNVRLEDTHLKIRVAGGIFKEAIPTSYFKGSAEKIRVNYVISGENTFSFSAGKNNSNSDLIIDPTPSLLWCTYYGGSEADGTGDISNQYLNGGIAVDGSSNVYATGYTSSATNIATSGSYQSNLTGSQAAFLAKFNSTGTTLLWGTYLDEGGCFGAGGTGVACDPSGNVYVTGFNDAFGSVFIAKFSSTGAYDWSTTAGGPHANFIYGGPAIAVDASGNVFITGSAGSSGACNTVPGNGQAFVAKYNTSGTQQWLTPYGPLQYNSTNGNAIALDSAGNVYITGTTSANSGIATSGTYQSTYVGAGPDQGGDVFLAKFNSSGTLQWGTYYAGMTSCCFGGGNNEGAAITVDNTGIYITGLTIDNTGVATSGTYKSTFSGTAGSNPNIFVAKFSFTGGLDWGTYYGGAGGAYADAGMGIVTNGNGNVYVTGATTSSSNIASANTLQGSLSGSVNAFLANFNSSNGTLTWGTYFHGTSNGTTSGTGIAQGINGKLYMLGEVTDTSGLATSGAWQTVYGGSQDAFIASFSAGATPLSAGITATPPNCNGSANGSATINPIGGTPNYTYLWSPGGQTSQTITGLSAGTYIVTVTDSVHATFIDSVSLSQPQPVVVTASQDTSVCSGQTVSLMASASGGTPAYTYKWSPSMGLNDSTGSTVTAISNHTISYSVTGSDTNSCHSIPKTVTITVVPLPVPGIISAIPDTACYAATAHLTSSGISADQIQWQYLLSGTGYIIISGADGSGYITPSILQATGYRVVVNNGSCSDTSSGFILNVRPALPPPSLSASDTLICSNDSARIQVITSYSSYRWNDGDTTNYTYVNAAGDYRVTVTNANGCIAVSNNQNISVYPVPSVAIDVQGDTLSAFNSISYQWLLNGTVIPGATHSAYVALVSGNYAVQVTDSNGCTAQSSDANIALTGVNNIEKGNGWSVFPNPFTSSIYIQNKNAFADLNSILIYDLTGSLLVSKAYNMQNGVMEIELSDLATGIYYLKIKTNQGDSVYRLVKTL